MIIPKNILLVRTDRIGDVVLSLPLAEIIKKYYPECKITFLVRDYTKDILEDHPFVDNILILEELNGKIPILKNVRNVKKFKFNSSIIVYPTFQTSLIIFLSGIRNRIGTGYRWYSFLFNKKIYEHRKYAEKHELEYNVNLLKAFGISEEINPDNVNFNIQVNRASQEKIQHLLVRDGINNDKAVIIIHPGSGGSAVDLPLEKFKILVEELSKQENYQIIITGSKSEVNMCNELEINNRIKNYAGLFNLSELIALINRSFIFISNSTGPLHIAAALGKFVIGFYPHLLACSSKRWGPYTTKKKIFSPETECTDCKKEQCSSSECMNSIKVTEIVVEVDRIYNLVHNFGDF
jgi:lipopolysaccharide heptosyltransferase II